MPTRRSADTPATESSAVTQPPAGAGEQVVAASEAIVIRVKKKKKKKRKYTKGLKELQQLERGLTRSARRVSGAVDKGLGRYRSRANRSSRKKKDGTIRDFAKNWNKGISKGLKEAADAPYDVVRFVSTKRLGKGVRNVLRATSPVLYIFR